MSDKGVLYFLGSEWAAAGLVRPVVEGDSWFVEGISEGIVEPIGVLIEGVFHYFAHFDGLSAHLWKKEWNI